MPKTQLSKESKEALVRAKERGDTDRVVASQFAIGRGTVSRIYARARTAMPLTRLPGSGRRKKTTERQAIALQRISKADPRKTAADIAKEANTQFGVKISRQTASRILESASLFARRPAKKPLISEKNRRARLRFAKDHLTWTSADWAKVLWSDESKFNLFSSDGIRYVRRPPGKRYDVRYQVPTVKNSKSVMVWGG
uniref:Transposase Tc1-like domain-containing protein n=1 Tax=Plectus sambesii TaxID=2011161 RepID=A0A914VV34_9BILA